MKMALTSFALTFLFKAKGRFFSAMALGKNAPTIDGVPEPKDLPIKQMGDVVVMYQAVPAIFEAISHRIDFSFLSRRPLGEFMLYEGFYLPLAKIIAQDRLLEREADGTIPDLGCQVIFVSQDKAFVFNQNGFAHIQDVGVIGDGKEEALAYFKASYTGLDPKEDITNALVASAQFRGMPAYPLLIPNFENKTFAFHPEKGEDIVRLIPSFPEISEEDGLASGASGAKA
jgi:hypothetical protein